MTVKNLFFYTISIFIICINDLSAQSSIYQDAKRLAAISKSNTVPIIDFTKMQAHYSSGKDKFTYSFERGLLDINIHADEGDLPPPYPMSTFGVFEFPMFVNDTLQIILSDTTLLFGDTLLHNVTIDYNSDSINIYTTNRSTPVPFNSSQTFFQQEKGEPLTASVLSYQSDLAFEDMMTIMKSHSNFIIKEEEKRPTYESLNLTYRDNPFLGELIQQKVLALPSTDDFFTSKLTLQQYAKEKEFATYLDHNYEWLKALYGDSTVHFTRKVSYKDVAGNYRTPIVTSQKELIAANKIINETSKNRNFLDARTVAVGLSDFIAERAQEELNLTFFNRFKENLKEASELTILFPETRNLLFQFEISNYKTLLSNAREAFTVDLDNLGLHFPDILELPKYRDLYNSPEVYNVSLIYSIANMAYKEIPVEDILMIGFQKLQNREINLSKDINLTLADKILNPTPIPKQGLKKDKNAIQLKVQPGTEIPLLEKHMNDYLSSLEAMNNDINELFDDLSDEIRDIRSMPGIAPTPFTTDISETTKRLSQSTIIELTADFRPIINNLFTKQEEMQNSFFGDQHNIFYHNRMISVDGSSLDFYRAVLNANLNKKEYYRDLLGFPTLEDYELYLKGLPEDENRILARGIATTRNLLAKNLEAFLAEKLIELESIRYGLNTIKKNVLYAQLEENSAKNQMLTFLNRTEFFKGVIDEEIFFWRNALQKDQSDHQIAALYHLKGILENSYYIQVFNDAHQNHKENVSIEKFVSQSFNDGSFQMILKEAEDEFTAVRAHLYSKKRQLKQLYGDLKIDPILYEEKSRFYNLYANNVNLKSEEGNQTITHQIDSINLIYEQKMKQLDSNYEEQIANDTLLQSVSNQLSAVRNKIEQFMINGEDESELMKQHDTLRARQFAIYQQYQKQNEQQHHQLETEKRAQLENIRSNKISLENIYEYKASPLSKDTFFIKNASEFEGSKLYSLYIEEGRKREAIDNIPLWKLSRMEYDIKNLIKNIDTIKQKRVKVINHIKDLETDHCKHLVDAKINAQNLAKSLEVAIHIMYAFRDYKGLDSTLYYTDTTQLRITNNQIDSITGTVIGMSVIDTFRLNEKKIVESTHTKPKSHWISRDSFKALQANELEWNLFLGLLYERLNAIEDLPNFSSEGVAILASKFLEITHEIETQRKNLRIKKAAKKEKVTFKDYYPFIRSTVDMFNTVIQTQTIGDRNLIGAFPALTNVPKISDEALSLYENIYVKSYSAAILNAMELLRIITTDRLDTKEKRRSARAINAVFTYGTFMANMIDAETSDQVKTILKSVTLPPGSSRIKRETTSSFTINSYLGASAARDVLIDTPQGIDRFSYGAALSVPIGFSYSVSPKWLKNNSSFSLFVPLLDLGAITAFRQNPKQTNYSIEALPEFEWKNLFSPGAFLIYNLANSPFSAGIGGQYGPQLREIKFETGAPISVNSFRFPMVFFNIDVPLFNLHTGTKKIIIK